MPSYTARQFEKDLKQLGGMIENFYTQQGGVSKKSRRKDAVGSRRKEKRGGAYKQQSRRQDTMRSKRRRQRGGEREKRNFKIISVNNRPYPFPNSYKGAEPKDAAKKAMRYACKKLKINKNNCKLTFVLKETTRGSSKREYGPYIGFRKKLAKPKVLNFKGMKKYVQTHEFVVKKESSRK
jgi:hypothetical protein